MEKVCWSCDLPKVFPEEFNAQGKLCLECHRDKERKRREDDREAYNAYIRGRRKTIPLENAPCIDCGKEKETSKKFLYCTECLERRQRERKKEYNARNREKFKPIKDLRRRVLSAFVRDIKKTKACERCGCSDYRCLTFHHIGEKEFEISVMVRRRKPKEAILEEMMKCIVLCANCHAIEHFVE